MRNYTYIAADFDHDKNAVEFLEWMKKNRYISYLNAHELQQSSDSSLPCSIKKSLKFRMDQSKLFVLIVGMQTNTVSKGGCQLCNSYNSYTQSCARGGYVDYRSYIKFECDIAVHADVRIVVLYKNSAVDRSLCPENVRWIGEHQKMIYLGTDGQYHWDIRRIASVFNRQKAY